MKRRIRTYLRLRRLETEEANVRTPKPDSERRIGMAEMANLYKYNKGCVRLNENGLRKS